VRGKLLSMFKKSRCGRGGKTAQRGRMWGEMRSD